MIGCCGMGVWMMLLGLILFLAIAAGIILLIVWVIRRSSKTTGTKDTAYEALNQRYARGEIELEEFERKKRELDLS